LDKSGIQNARYCFWRWKSWNHENGIVFAQTTLKKEESPYKPGWIFVGISARFSARCPIHLPVFLG
jgi:hypothetical protein